MFTQISNDAEKIFGIGLSRTGTTSLNKALQMLGLNAFHWNFRPQNRLLTLEDAYFCDAITDINAAWNFETLARTFPRSRFIYTVRPLESWEPSVANHYNARSPALLKERLKNTPVLHKATGATEPAHDPLFHAIHHALYTGHATWHDAYSAHDARVRAYFSSVPERLLTLDVFAGGHGWPELCTFLGRHTPDKPYPNLSWRRSEAAQPEQASTGAYLDDDR